ncbi:MAG: LSU ribosomal protein L13p (L13Ae) [Atribacteria bacterium 34_868]|jgi:large subunit ribosomal protein L13|nr:MAG: LSU ribosomal protein L13p (L13Ae) [Atribacteria bacterium 34_868]MDD5497045.1 50S ribosomal protein L13 [Atribacterota bacterium]
MEVKLDENRENKKNIDRNWYLIDAEGKILGRMATEIATILRGKNRANFDKSQDLGNYIIVINAEKIKLTGEKEKQKLYRYHTGYPGSLKEITYKEMIQKKPELVIENAVRGMLPKNKLSRSLIKRLKVYRGSQHPHSAQKIEILD